MEKSEFEILDKKLNLLYQSLNLMMSQYQLLSLTVEETLKLCIDLKCQQEPSLSPDQLRIQIGQSIKVAFDKMLDKRPPSDLN